MEVDVFVPLLLPLAGWPVARWLAPRLSPRAASWVLTGCALVLAVGSTSALALLTARGLARVPWVASLGGFGDSSFEDVNVPLAATSGVALIAAATALAWAGVQYVRRHRRINAELDAHGTDEVVLLPGAEPIAFAVAGRGGRIAVSSGLLAVLDARERRALFAHERAHLALRHHFFAAALTIATALNPLLRPLGTAARFALERWADETAAARVGDRRVVATAVAKAALAGKTGRSPVLAAAGGPVPQRVRALLTPRSPKGPLAALAIAAVLAVCGASAANALDAAIDLHLGVELAQSAYPHGH
ncbi:M56 family metallopeptidase [Amycolatopsis rhabdoformis]|uniref:M56 family metallopeptidase n=1 Tax=Amycolatopsis rhabdoformis TaxID=1448059 RepID=A0ABZ1HYA3_9PSEU|nr:M56 family metallopeptidase [Amycolatopsis rhabdoformis]WSE27117.1 M56 family metallopeptidase [Amycolatopsis rhabdoformis]